jgi:uncharacterized protein (TIGR02271 family)
MRQSDGSFVLTLRDEPFGANHLVIPVVHEELAVDRRVVDSESGVRVHKRVSTQEHHVDEPVLRDDVRVERIPLNAVVREAPPVRYEGDTTIIPVCEEVVVVEKRLLLKEELRITRTTSQARHTETVPLRYEHVEVEHFGNGQDVHGAEPGAAPSPDDAERHSASSFRLDSGRASR